MSVDDADSYLNDPASVPSANLTPLGRKILSEQLAQRTRYSVTPASDYIFHVRREESHSDDESDEAQVRAPVTRVVVLISVGDRFHVVCSCPFFSNFGIPCRHILTVNEGLWDLDDVDVFWTLALLRGDFDAVMRKHIVDGDVRWAHGLVFPVFRGHVKPPSPSPYDDSIDPRSFVIDSTSQLEPTDHTLERPQEEPSSSSTFGFRELTERWKLLLTSVSDNGECMAYVRDLLGAVEALVEEKVRALAIPPALQHPGGSSLVDPIVAPATSCVPSSHRQKNAYEKHLSRRRREAPDLESVSASQVSLTSVVDAQGRQKGRKRKQTQAEVANEICIL